MGRVGCRVRTYGRLAGATVPENIQWTIFSHRVTNQLAPVVIGSSKQIPLCRTCYLYINNL